MIEDRDPETESEELQLSNFSLLEDRETKSIELYLTKLGAYREDKSSGVGLETSKMRSRSIRRVRKPDARPSAFSSPILSSRA